jgi:hypothetical protein
VPSRIPYKPWATMWPKSKPEAILHFAAFRGRIQSLNATPSV